MAYEKRVCVMKQLKKGFSADGGLLSGAVYCERLGSELTVTPRILGLSPLREGRYVLVVRAEGKDIFLELKGSETIRVSDAPSIKSGVAVLLCFVRGDAEAVAFGACGIASSDYRPMLEALVTGGKRRPIPAPLPPVQIPGSPAPNVPLAPGVPLPGEEDSPPFREQAAAYNDEAIAASDYFAPAQGNADEAGTGIPQAQEGTAAGDCHSQEDAANGFLRTGGSLTYYKEVRERLTAVMEKYPPDTRLKGAFPQSEWVRSDGALLGIVYEEGIPRYLCVAVEKNGDPPEDMKENCAFVPASPFSDDEGFWVVFQDADTGAYVKVSDN